MSVFRVSIYDMISPMIVGDPRKRLDLVPSIGYFYFPPYT